MNIQKRHSLRRAVIAVAAATAITMGLSACIGMPLYYNPPANTPDASFSVRLDSVPTGASVYASNPDGTLGQLVGSTPMTWTISTAVMHDNNGAVGIAPVLPGTRGNFLKVWVSPSSGSPFALREIDGRLPLQLSQSLLGFSLVLSAGVLKDGYGTVPVQKTIAYFYSDTNGNAPTYPVQDVYVTIPLPGASSSAPAQPPAQQQQQQQIIIINN